MLPLSMILPNENEGYTEPIFGQASAASILTAYSHGDYSGPTLYLTELPDPTRVGLSPRIKQPELHQSNALLCHEDLLVNMPWGDHELQRPNVQNLRLHVYQGLCHIDPWRKQNLHGRKAA